MKKNLLFTIIGLIAGTTLTATAAYVYTARDIGYTPSDENWNVTNASDALSSLKEDLNEVNTNVTEYKQQITEALADKGIDVDENSTMADIQSGITNISTAPTLIGRYTGDKTIDVSSYIKNGDTSANFILDYKGYSGRSGQGTNPNNLSVTLTDGSLKITGANGLGGPWTDRTYFDVVYDLYYVG